MDKHVGLAQDPQPEDATFHDERDALKAGKHLHNNALPFSKEIVGIWDESDELVYLYFNDDLFKRV